MENTRKRHKTKYPGITFRLVDEADPDSQRRYIVWYSSTDGKGRTETLPLGATLEDARLRQGELKRKKSQGETLLKTKLTVGELLDTWLEKAKPRLVPHTYKTYEWAIRDHLKPRIGYSRIQDLTASDLAAMRVEMVAAGLKKGSIDKIETPLKNALRVAARDGLISSSPFDKLLPHERVKNDRKEMRCLTKSELSTLLSNASSLRWRALFATLLFTGLRISEALSLTWTDIDFTSSQIRVIKGKTKAAKRDVMMIPDLRSLLRRHKLKQPPGTDLVFATRTGLPINATDARQALYRIEEKAGIPRYTPHELRHTFASILIHQNEPITFISKQMGHANVKITYETYAHLFEEQESVTKASERLQASFGGLV